MGKLEQKNTINQKKNSFYVQYVITITISSSDLENLKKFLKKQIYNNQLMPEFKQIGVDTFTTAVGTDEECNKISQAIRDFFIWN